MNETRRRAVVTGIGVVSPVGHTLEAFRSALVQGRSGIRPVTAFDTSGFRSGLGGEVRDFDPLRDLPAGEGAACPDRYVQFALAAGRRALANAGLAPDLSGRRAALSLGTCNGGLRTAEAWWQAILAGTGDSLDERTAYLLRYSALGRILAAAFDVHGPTVIVTTACSSSTNALGNALDLVQSGRADLVLAGGSDALCLTTWAGFSAVKAMAEPGPCHPYSSNAHEHGMSLGEGAAVWVVESWEAAEARGATPLAELLSYGLSGDAHHLTAPDPTGDGAARAMRAALDRAGLDPADLGSINAHGTGTEANDRAESKALRRLLEGAAVPVTSTKSFLGHTLGAAGVLEATASVLGMVDGFIPPTLGFDATRSSVDLDVVGPALRPTESATFLKVNLAFSGNNAALIVARPDPSRPAPAPTPARRVVITGIGAVTPVGVGTKALWDALAAGRTAARTVTRFDTTGCRGHRAALLDPFDWRQHERRIDLRPMNPIGRFATLAAREAIERAGLPLRPRSLESSGLIVGVNVGPSEEALMRRVWSTAAHVADPVGFAESVANSVAGYVSQALYLKGHSSTVSQGPQAGVAAVALAAEAVALGHAARVIAGAADEVFERSFRNDDASGWLPPDDADSGGAGWRRTVPGEGAAMMVVEEAGEAAARGATPLAEVLGWAASTDPGDLTGLSTSGESLAAAIREALERGACLPSEVDAVADAPVGAPGRDREDAALVAVFGARIPARLSTVHAAGYADASSALMAAAACLEGGSWTAADAPGPAPRRLLVLGTSPLGMNWVILLGRGQ
jgi:3-oxoacyl-[acyl-carrier-protein] synthase II